MSTAGWCSEKPKTFCVLTQPWDSGSLTKVHIPTYHSGYLCLFVLSLLLFHLFDLNTFLCIGSRGARVIGFSALPPHTHGPGPHHCLRLNSVLDKRNLSQETESRSPPSRILTTQERKSRYSPKYELQNTNIDLLHEIVRCRSSEPWCYSFIHSLIHSIDIYWILTIGQVPKH